MNFKEINCEELKFNPFTKIGKEWMLITAGTEEKYNTMTASWGGLGVLWNKNVAFAFIRPQRYTLEFVKNSDYFTLSFFEDDYKKALSFCGKYSGRDYDKAKETNLTPCFNFEAPTFEQAKLVLVCKKLYSQYLTEESVIEESVKNNYPTNDYHEMFIGEIVHCYVSEN